MDQPNEPSHYCIDGLVDFQNVFLKTHSLLTLFRCLSGIVGNSLVIYVLSRPQMRSPINVLFTSRAFIHVVVNIIYVPCVIGVFLPHLFGTTNYANNFVPVLDMIAVWLTVTIATWSYINVLHPQRARVSCTTPRTIIVIIIACIICPLLCIPMYHTYCVKGFAATEEDYGLGSEELLIGASYAPPIDMGDVDDKILVDVIEWFYGVVLKVIPCAVVTAFTLEIWSKQSKENFYTKIGSNTDHTPNTSTNMLLVFFIIFSLYELIECLINLSSFILGETFVYNSHKLLFEVMDLLSLLNRNAVFFLYFAMSVQFRTIVMSISKPKILRCFSSFYNDPESLISLKSS